MSLNWNAEAVPEDVRTIIATEDDRMRGVKKGDRIMSPITHTIIFATMATGIGVLNDATIPEFAARCALLQMMDGNFLHEWDDDGNYVGTTPLTLEHIAAHKGLSTNVFPYETRAKWVARSVTKGHTGPFAKVTEPKAGDLR
jgi:hypothetical protein